MSSESSVTYRRRYNSNIYKYYPSKGNSIFCVVCSYRYKKDAPLSTLQKHLRVKHGFSMRNPPTPMAMRQAIYDAKKELGLLDNDDSDMIEIDSASPLNSIKTRKISTNALLNPDPTSLEDAIMDWVCNEGIPMSLISSSGFRQIIQICNSNLVVPSEPRLRMLALKRNPYVNSQTPKLQFEPLNQYTISPNEKSYLRDSSNHPNDYN